MPGTPRQQSNAGSDQQSPHFGTTMSDSSPGLAHKDHFLPPKMPASFGKTHAHLKGVDAAHESSNTSQRRHNAAMSENGHSQATTSQVSLRSSNNPDELKKETVGAQQLNALENTIDQLFITFFRSGRTRAWEKSRQIVEVDWLPTRDELIEQLKPEEEGLVPLNAISGRIVLYAWQLFANQGEINSSLSPLKRRKRIYDDAHEARKQLIKLLVLVQWSKVAPNLQKARSLIAFVNDHFVQTDAAVASLAETRGILTNARLRRYDLVSAIEVLGTGAPLRIPSVLKETSQPRKRFTNAEAVKLVEELNGAIQLRLSTHETLPVPMTSYSIVDGRVCFKVPMLFEADLTLSGNGPDERWWLLRIKYDFNVSGEGADKFPRQPKKSHRLHLLAMADAELAPRSLAAVVEPQMEGEVTTKRRKLGDANDFEDDVIMRDAVGPLKLDEEAVTDRKDAPLVRLYNLLQLQALHYRLDILHWQALQQVNRSWGKCLSVRMDNVGATRVLRIAYWQQPELSMTEAQRWRPTAGGSLAISVQEVVTEAGPLKIVQDLLMNGENGQHGREQTPERLQIMVNWTVEEPARDFLGSPSVVIEAQSLDAEAVLLTVTSRHAEAAVKAIEERLTSSGIANAMVMRECRQRNIRGLDELCLQLCLNDKVQIILRVDQVSGRVYIDEANHSGDPITDTLASHDWLMHLQEASAKVNEKPEQIVAILRGLRNKIFVEDLQETAALLGINVTTSMPLRQVDFTKLRAKPGSLIYITLVQCPGYYLVLHVAQESLRVALMCAGTFFEDLTTSMRIVSVEWLDWQRVILPESHSKVSPRISLIEREEEVIGFGSISQEELCKLYSYSVALISYHKVEQQLRAKNLFFVHVGGGTNMKAPPTDDQLESMLDASNVGDIVPSLCLPADQLLGSSKRPLTRKNVSICLREWWDPRKAHVVFSVMLTLKPDVLSPGNILETAQQKVDLHGPTNVLTFFFRDIDNCLALFLASWRQVEGIAKLAMELLLEKQAAFFTVSTCDLTMVRFAYADGLSAEVRRVHDLSQPGRGRFKLDFTSTEQGRSSNPHRVITLALTQWLNRLDNSSHKLWPAFLEILRQTLPLLRNISRYEEECCDEIECPEVQVQHPTSYRLLFLGSYHLDVRLISGGKVLFSASARGKDGSGGDTSDVHIQDEFALADDMTLRSFSQPHNTSNTAIPSLHVILATLAHEYHDAHNKREEKQSRKYSLLTFPNGLLAPNRDETIDWLLPRIVKRIQEAIA